ncbi:lipase [Clostridium putrefaciens]|uniref:Lipase n=1 Tax=Clostridium putrefaciens TaxID=99675 RepID=A0A381JAX0_9CLOT|nr:alpha/beta hydrolase [Clostridium putrefaciens]SUY48404.1 lipase [Clostridium putrefaciens]
MKNKNMTIFLLLSILILAPIILVSVLKGPRNFITKIGGNPKVYESTVHLGEEYLDIPYKVLEKEDLTLDFYSPSKSNKTAWPLIIYIHGGSWAFGDKSIDEGFIPILNKLKEKGYAIASINYRLSSSSSNFPSPVEDCKDAIRWFYKNKDIYNIDTDNIGLLGVSSGAHLALLTSYSNETEFIGDEGLSSYKSNIKYVIDYSGPTSFDINDIESSDETSISIIKNLLGENNIYKEDLLNLASPINYINPNSTPTLIIHGEKDTTVPIDQSIKLYEKGLDAGMDIKLLKVANGDHSLSNIDYIDMIKVATETLRFIEKNK